MVEGQAHNVATAQLWENYAAWGLHPQSTPWLRAQPSLYESMWMMQDPSVGKNTPVFFETLTIGKQCSVLRNHCEALSWQMTEVQNGINEDDADSAIWSKNSMPRCTDLPDAQPHSQTHINGRDTHSFETAEIISMQKEINPDFGEYDDESIKSHLGSIQHNQTICDICLGNVHNAAKYCKTCSASFCVNHLADHYKAQAFSSHQLVPEQTPRVSPEKKSSLSISGPLDLPEVRVMLLGKTGAGKSASGNIILGREAFKSEMSALPVTKYCESQSGLAAGRNITIIDTPGIPSEKGSWLSAKKMKELVPHVFLLVIPLRRIAEEDCKEVNWIQSNFGEEALKFTIALFTGGGVMDQNPEEFLNDNCGLQTILDRVEGKHHVLNDNFPTDHQVKGLIKKIDHTLMKNAGYANNNKVKLKMKTAVKQEEERKARKQNREQKLRENKANIPGIPWMLLIVLGVTTSLQTLRFHHITKGPVDLPEVSVMLLGKTGAGKSASGNTILGREAFKSEMSALPVAEYCESQHGVVEGRNITVIDTPGIAVEKGSWLSEKAKTSLGPHIFLLVIHLDRFEEENDTTLKWIQTNLGEEALKFTIILFTGGDLMETRVERFLEESSGLKTLVSSAGGGYHIFKNINLEGKQQVKGLLEKMEAMLRSNAGYSYSRGLREQVKTTVRDEEDRKRREMERYFREAEMEQQKMEQKINKQIKHEMTAMIANATALSNELRENITATREQNWRDLIGFVSGGISHAIFLRRVQDIKCEYNLKWLFVCVLSLSGFMQNYLTFLIGFISGAIVHTGFPFLCAWFSYH
ncbi:GTPase IMAP family member 8-like isoform X3 [Sardina pilchardus]|uniref:GTPase IMAP family member 8-like isoform X3 n=1 Tax=Sardina pilchardus TaxID=27697 RepID=UPI002E12CD68